MIGDGRGDSRHRRRDHRPNARGWICLRRDVVRKNVSESLEPLLNGFEEGGQILRELVHAVLDLFEIVRNSAAGRDRWENYAGRCCYRSKRCEDRRGVLPHMVSMVCMLALQMVRLVLIVNMSGLSEADEAQSSKCESVRQP